MGVKVCSQRWILIINKILSRMRPEMRIVYRKGLSDAPCFKTPRNLSTYKQWGGRIPPQIGTEIDPNGDAIMLENRDQCYKKRLSVRDYLGKFEFYEELRPGKLTNLHLSRPVLPFHPNPNFAKVDLAPNAERFTGNFQNRGLGTRCFARNN